VIFRSVLDASIAASNYVKMLLQQSEVKVEGRLAELLDILSELGYYNKRGNKFKRTNKTPPPGASSLVARFFDEVAVPLLLGSKPRIDPEVLLAAISLFQPLRIRALRYFGRGALALVAGWAPCGFSTELASHMGYDLVIADDNWEILSAEEDRTSVLPHAQELKMGMPSPYVFVAFEIMPMDEIGSLAEKYGHFDLLISCHRLIKSADLAEKAYYVRFGGVYGRIADLISEALGLGKGAKCSALGNVVVSSEYLCIADVSES